MQSHIHFIIWPPPPSHPVTPWSPPLSLPSLFHAHTPLLRARNPDLRWPALDQRSLQCSPERTTLTATPVEDVGGTFRSVVVRYVTSWERHTPVISSLATPATSTHQGSTTRACPACWDRLASFSSASTPHFQLGSEIICFKLACFIFTVPSPLILTRLASAPLFPQTSLTASYITLLGGTVDSNLFNLLTSGQYPPFPIRNLLPLLQPLPGTAIGGSLWAANERIRKTKPLKVTTADDNRRTRHAGYRRSVSAYAIHHPRHDGPL